MLCYHCAFLSVVWLGSHVFMWCFAIIGNKSEAVQRILCLFSDRMEVYKCVFPWAFLAYASFPPHKHIVQPQSIRRWPCQGRRRIHSLLLLLRLHVLGDQVIGKLITCILPCLLPSCSWLKPYSFLSPIFSNHISTGYYILIFYEKFISMYTIMEDFMTEVANFPLQFNQKIILINPK